MEARRCGENAIENLLSQIIFSNVNIYFFSSINKYLNLKIQSGGVGIKNACIALYYKTPTHNFIYLIKGNDDNWNIPGGRIDDKENSLEAAFREFKEETGGFLLDKWAPRTNQQRKFYKYEFREHTAIWW